MTSPAENPVPCHTQEGSAQPVTAQAALDRAWQEVNVLGAPDAACTTDDERAYSRGIGDALTAIEKLGGRQS